MTANNISIAIISALYAVSKDWARQRKTEEKNATSKFHRYARLVRNRQCSIKEAAHDVMEEAYLRASADGTLPANARQVMYAARPLVQERTGKQLDDQYFTQTLLPDYMNEHGVNWDVVFDDRGHFQEPHTGRSVGLGTLAVRNYLGDIGWPDFEPGSFSPGKVKTCGPDYRFGAVLFIEKEGFLPLLGRASIASRYDIAIMSTKGLSNTASRELVDEICGFYGIPLLVLHDFDKSGFSIVGTLRQSNRRYSFVNDVKVIDIGLRLADIQGLEAENVFDRGSKEAISANLAANGATPDEIEFLLRKRVELNAFTSDQLVTFIEHKLVECGVKKILPGIEQLAEAYKMSVRGARIQKMVMAEIEKATGEDVDLPADLRERVLQILQKQRELPWDRAVRMIAGDAV